MAFDYLAGGKLPHTGSIEDGLRYISANYSDLDGLLEKQLEALGAQPPEGDMKTACHFVGMAIQHGRADLVGALYFAVLTHIDRARAPATEGCPVCGGPSVSTYCELHSDG